MGATPRHDATSRKKGTAAPAHTTTNNTTTNKKRVPLIARDTSVMLSEVGSSNRRSHAAEASLPHHHSNQQSFNIGRDMTHVPPGRHPDEAEHYEKLRAPLCPLWLTNSVHHNGKPALKDFPPAIYNLTFNAPRPHSRTATSIPALRLKSLSFRTGTKAR